MALRIWKILQLGLGITFWARACIARAQTCSSLHWVTSWARSIIKVCFLRLAPAKNNFNLSP